MAYRPPPAPLYQRVYGVIYRRIQTGQYPTGSALSTEERLASEFGVSKATVRQAVGELVKRGLVVRQQGRGTFVCDDAASQSPHAFVGSFADLIINTSNMALRDQSVERGAIFPADVRDQLGMTEQTGTVLRHWRDVDGVPFVYSIQYLSPRVHDYLKPSELTPPGQVTLMNQRGLLITGARQTMSAELVDVEIAKQLDVEFGGPVLFGERVVHSVLGPIEVDRSWYRGDLFKWEADLAFTWTGGELSIAVKDDATEPAEDSAASGA